MDQIDESGTHILPKTKIVYWLISRVYWHHWDFDQQATGIKEQFGKSWRQNWFSTRGVCRAPLDAQGQEDQERHG